MTFRAMTMPAPHPSAAASVVEARFAYRVAGALTEGHARLPHDVSERLKVARRLALERAAQRARAAAPRVATGAAVVTNGGGSAALSGWGASFGRGSGGQGGSRWWRFASALPLVALVAGLVLIQQQHASAQITEAARIDADLLGDTLPPDAYRDAGFVEFLKTPRD